MLTVSPFIFLRSILHTESTCLYHRVRLEAQRRIQQAFTWARPRRGGSIPLELPLHPPLFPARLHLGGVGPSGTSAHFLNQIWPLEVPMNWRPPAGQLEIMNLHYMEYLEGLTPQDGQRFVHDWIKANPPYCPGYWRDRWNSYALSIRCVVWMQEIARGRLTPDELTLASLCEQIRFLKQNLELDICGNHLVKNIKALLYAGACFHGSEPDSWSNLGRKLLGREISTQVLADGVHFERSPSYHLQVFADLLECYQLLPDLPIRALLGESLDQMAQASADLTHPDGLISLFNDGGLHMAYSPAVCLNAYTQLRARQVSQNIDFSLSDAGYFGAREGLDFVLVDCGKIAPDSLPAHGHGDIFSFEWSLKGKRWIVDQGVFEYKEGLKRIHSRATSSHNTVTLDGLDQCEFWKSFRVGRRAKVTLHRYEAKGTHFVLEGSHDGYAHLPGGPIHTRVFDAEPSRIIIEDRVHGGNGQKVEARLLLHPDVRIDPTSERRFELILGEDRVILEGTYPLRVLPDYWYPDFGVKVPTFRIVLDYGPAPCSGSFTLSRC